jgi:hypothetical protein
MLLIVHPTRLSICLTAFALPIVLTWVGYLPFMTGALERIKPWLYPSIIRTYHDRPLPFLLCNVPTVGQSFYIAVLVLQGRSGDLWSCDRKKLR